MNVQLGRIEVDAVGLATLTGFLLCVGVYLARCQAVKARNGSGHSSIAAGMFRLAASRGDVHAMACLGFAQGFAPNAGLDGFTALHAACIQGQQGKQHQPSGLSGPYQHRSSWHSPLQYWVDPVFTAL